MKNKYEFKLFTFIEQDYCNPIQTRCNFSNYCKPFCIYSAYHSGIDRPNNDCEQHSADRMSRDQYSDTPLQKTHVFDLKPDFKNYLTKNKVTQNRMVLEQWIETQRC